MILLPAILLAAASLDPVADAAAALSDGLSAVAIQKLTAAPAITAREGAGLLLARAYVEDGQPAMAIEVLKPLPPGPEKEFWTAQAAAALGNFDRALASYRKAAESPVFRASGNLGEARMLRGLGKNEEALVVLKNGPGWKGSGLETAAGFEIAEALLDLGRADEARTVLDGLAPNDRRGITRRDFLTARALAASGDDAGAIRIFGSLSPVDAPMAIAAVCGQADALARSGQGATAESLLEEFASKNPDLPDLAAIFSRLDRLYAQQPNPNPGELKRWASDEAPSERKILSAYYLARLESRLGREDRAEKLLESTVSTGADSTTARLAGVELAKIRLKEGRAAEALKALPDAGEVPEGDFLRGLAESVLGNNDAAVAAFLSASASPSLAESALLNASFCELLSGGQAGPAFEAFQKRFPTSARLDTLRLQEAFQLARKGNPAAVGLLSRLGSSADPKIAGAANLALAEWQLGQDDRKGAEGALRRISTQPGVDAAQADALAVFLSDDGSDPSAAIAAAGRFLATHPGAPAEPEVRMKLGELLYRKGDFAGARVQLETLATRFPGSPQEIPALFLAAQSAARLQTPAAANDAMILYEQVAASSGPLALRARLEQAVLQNILGKPGEAIVIFDRILSSNPDPETRAAALMEKGKTLAASGGEGTAAALAIWRDLAGNPSLSQAWRNQANVRIGAALEISGAPDAAVAAYYDVLRAGRDSSADYFWFYKAGFSAARLLEAAKRWEQAIKVYEMIAEANGPRSEEARSRINKIRLENFLWEEKSEP